MNLSELLKKTCKEMHVSISEMARRTNQTPSNLTMKIRRQSVDFEEFINYMEVLGVRVNFSLTYPDGMQPELPALDRRLQEKIAALEAGLEAEKRNAEFEKGLNADTRTALYNICGFIDRSLKNNGEKRVHEETLLKAKAAADGLARLYDSMSGSVASAEPATAAEDKLDIRMLVGKRVLLAEDNELNRDLTREMLEEAGLIVDCASDGAEAVKMFKAADSGAYVCILMDVRMPGIDGIEATRLIRALPNRIRAGVPIIAMTASAFEEDRRKALEAGMDAYLTKPVEADRLTQTIAKLV